jgi:uncharacterized protein YegL
MPKLEQHSSGHFGFSAVRLNELDASEYTLVTVTVDDSGSTQGFSRDMEGVLKEIVEACCHSPRSDNLLLRVIRFSNNVVEIHGFKKLTDCNLADYDNILEGRGLTALYDAVINSGEAMNLLGTDMSKKDYTVNGINFIITDGCENQSKLSLNLVKKALSESQKNESLESAVTIVVGVDTGEAGVQQVLTQFSGEIGAQFEWLKDATKSSLAKLAKFVSRSISSSSQSLQSNTAPVSLTLLEKSCIQ